MWARSGLNGRSSDYESAALTDYATSPNKRYFTKCWSIILNIHSLIYSAAYPTHQRRPKPTKIIVIMDMLRKLHPLFYKDH